MPRVRIQSSADWHEYRRLTKALRDAARTDLRKELRQEIRKAGDPALTATKAAAHAIEMSGGPAGSTGLRKRIAAATKLQVLASGIRFIVRDRQVDPKYGPTLTAGSEGKTWRHPTFGHKPWVSQTGSPWFYPTLRAQGPAFRRAAIRAMHNVMRKIAG